MTRSPRWACPSCQSTAVNPIEGSSRFALVDYYRCDECGHVWNVPKQKDGPVHHVTPLKRPGSQPKRRLQAGRVSAPVPPPPLATLVKRGERLRAALARTCAELGGIRWERRFLVTPAELQREHAALLDRTAELQRTHRRLQTDPHDRLARCLHRKALGAHIAHLEEHARKLRGAHR